MSLRPLTWYASLATPKGRAEAGFCLVEGPRAVSQIVQKMPDAVDEILCSAETAGLYSALRQAAVRTLTSKQFCHISSNKTPQDVAAVVRIPAEIASRQLPAQAGTHILALESVQDPGNVGSLIRSAAALGFAGLIMDAGCADPLSPKVIQASAGALWSVWIRRGAHFYDQLAGLKEEGHRVIATALDGASSLPPDSGRKVVLVLGNEGSGITGRISSLADALLTVPMNRLAVESLNVAAAGAICMYRLSSADLV